MKKLLHLPDLHLALNKKRRQPKIRGRVGGKAINYETQIFISSDFLLFIFQFVLWTRQK
jgi:hypothetical protein